MPGNIILKIDGKDVKIRWNESREPTPEDVSYIENDYRQRQRGKSAFTGASAGAKVHPAHKAQPKAQPKPVVPQLPSNPILQRIQQGTTTQGVQQAVDVFREENRKNPAVTEAFGKIPTADEVRQGRKAGESAGQFASRKSNEATDAVKNNMLVGVAKIIVNTK